MTYCPELNKTVLKQIVECRLRGYCDGLNGTQVSTNINALKIGCQVCSLMYQEKMEIETKYRWEMIQEDSRNNTYIEYLKNFLNPSLIDQQSFCMSGQGDLKLRESLKEVSGFCYTINQPEGIYNEKT